MRRGDEISVAGQLFHTGARVVLWNDPGGYDAYRPHRRFEPEKTGSRDAPDKLARFGSFRGGLPPELAQRVREHGWRLEDLLSVVSQVVIHFDACGTSRQCFEVLQDIRGLSCHFLLDLDGTIYQTLDLKERAWHAAQANDASVGIEIANIGAQTNDEPLRAWYSSDSSGTRLTIPPSAEPSGLPRGFESRPARPELVRGRINGRDLVQYDFTEAQYLALENLLRSLRRIFPRLEADAPRDSNGRVSATAFDSDEALHRFSGVLGHWHVTPSKVDPGPAFDWERVLAAMRNQVSVRE